MWASQPSSLSETLSLYYLDLLSLLIISCRIFSRTRQTFVHSHRCRTSTTLNTVAWLAFFFFLSVKWVFCEPRQLSEYKQLSIENTNTSIHIHTDIHMYIGIHYNIVQIQIQRDRGGYSDGDKHTVIRPTITSKETISHVKRSFVPQIGKDYPNPYEIVKWSRHSPKFAFRTFGVCSASLCASSFIVRDIYLTFINTNKILRLWKHK